MDQALRKRILDLMKRHNVMTIATVRKDGYPQATTVTYVNDGLTLYFGCEKTAQKVKNIKRNGKVSLTIDRDYRDWNQIKGLSMAADAEVLTDRDEARRVAALLSKKFPQWGAVPPDDVRFVKVVPKVISVLDYTQGFGHTDLVRA
jgi:general stress protein 26